MALEATDLAIYWPVGLDFRARKYSRHDEIGTSHISSEGGAVSGGACGSLPFSAAPTGSRPPLIARKIERTFPIF
jgi:hypothetical protein